MAIIALNSAQLLLTGYPVIAGAEGPMSIDIKDLLVAAGLGTFNSTTGWNICFAREPKTPDQCITIFDSGGGEANPKWLLDYPSIQVRIRGAKGQYLAAWRKAKQVKDALLGLGPQSVNAHRIVSITMFSEITPIGYDENERPILTINLRLIVEPVHSALSNREAL